MEPRLVLIDGNYLILRTFFGALNSDREEDPVRYAWMLVIDKILQVARWAGTRRVAMVMDGSKREIARYSYKGYKEGRERRLPEQFREALGQVEMVCRALGVSLLRHPSMEADDVIASVVRLNPEREITIFSEDKDFFQLLGPRVRMLRYNLVPLTLEDALAKLSLSSASQLVPYYAIVGDGSDNLPGVRGLGPKGALALLSRYGSLSAVLRAAFSEGPKDRLLNLVRASWRGLLTTWKLFRLPVHPAFEPREIGECFSNREGALAFLKANRYHNLFDKLSSYLSLPGDGARTEPEEMSEPEAP